MLEREPENVRANYILGVMLVEVGQFKEALPHLLKVAAARPNDGYAAYRIAECHRLDDAKACEEWGPRSRSSPIPRTPGCIPARHGIGPTNENRGSEARYAEHARLSKTPLKSWKLIYRRMGPLFDAVPTPTELPPKAPPAGPAFVAPTEVAKAAGDSLSVCDFDGDGRLDLFVAGKECTVLLGNADGTFARWPGIRWPRFGTWPPPFGRTRTTTG